MPTHQCQYCQSPTDGKADTCDECERSDAIAYQALRTDLDATELDAAIAQTVTLRGTR